MKTKHAKGNTVSNLYCFLDKDADMLYLSQGKPSSKDEVTEQDPDLLLRTDKKTGSVRGITVMNFSKRESGALSPIRLPVHAEWVAA